MPKEKPDMIKEPNLELLDLKDFEQPPDSRPIRFVETTEKTCKWPLSKEAPGPDMMCCGASIVRDSSSPYRPFCEYHAKIAFRPVGVRRGLRTGGLIGLARE